MGIMNAGKTTEQVIEGLQESIRFAKQALAIDLVNSVDNDTWFNSENIAKVANRIAELEGALEVAHLRKQLEDHEVPKEGIALALLKEAVRSADDTWSGRTNDVKRAFADGRREAIDEAQFDLR